MVNHTARRLFLSEGLNRKTEESASVEQNKGFGSGNALAIGLDEKSESFRMRKALRLRGFNESDEFLNLLISGLPQQLIPVLGEERAELVFQVQKQFGRFVDARDNFVTRNIEKLGRNFGLSLLRFVFFF